MSNHYSVFKYICNLPLHSPQVFSCSGTNLDEKWRRSGSWEQTTMNENLFQFASTGASWLTVLDVLRSDAAHGCPVVCHLLRGFHVLVVDALPKLVHEGHASQDAVLSIGTHSHHLTVNGHGSGDADDGQRDKKGSERWESSVKYRMDWRVKVGKRVWPGRYTAKHAFYLFLSVGFSISTHLSMSQSFTEKVLDLSNTTKRSDFYSQTIVAER